MKFGHIFRRILVTLLIILALLFSKYVLILCNTLLFPSCLFQMKKHVKDDRKYRKPIIFLPPMTLFDRPTALLIAIHLVYMIHRLQFR